MAHTKRRALITGINGQDGSYLAEYLLTKGYEVWGLSRTTRTRVRGTHVLVGDMRSPATLKRALSLSSPDEIYNLAAQTEIGQSFKNPKETFAINYKAFGKLVKGAMGQNPKVRIFHAGTSEMFKKQPAPRNERSPLGASNPYGESKLKAHRDFVVEYRKKYGLFICTGFLFNHLSPRSSQSSVARKITTGLSQIKRGRRKKLSLGNLDMKRDWGFAGDYVVAMHKTLQQKKPRDYIIASGRLHSVRELVVRAARELGIDIQWSGEGLAEVGREKKGRVLVDIQKEFYRPLDIPLKGDSARARNELLWEPAVSFTSLVRMMVRADRGR